MEISEDAVIVDSSRLKSVVWKDFDRIKNGETCVAVCRHCKKKLSGSSTSGTSHLRNHLIRCRRRSNHDIAQLLSTKGKKKEPGTLAIASISFDQEQRGGLVVANNSPLIPNNLINTTTTTATTTTCKFEQGQAKDVAINIRNNYYFDHKRSRLDLARMIILHNYPLTMVDHVGFKIFVRNLQPLFELVTMDVVEADCVEIYQNEKQKVCDLFDRLPGKISVSVDSWVASKGDARYLCLTAHCIDDTWQLKKKVLNFITVEEEDVSEVIMTCLREWDIDRKLFSMTFDSCSPTYDYVACRIRDLLLQNRFLLCNGQLFEVLCASNVIKLMAQDALEALSDVTNKIRESIKYVTSSQATQGRFNELVLQVIGETSSSSSSSSNQKCLCLDDPLRWNSTYLMLEIALEYKQAFSLLQEHDSLYPNMIYPSDMEWERASAVTSFLKLFAEVCNTFAGSSKQQHPTANIYFPEICDIHLHFIEWCQNPDDFVCSLASKMKIKFDEYWKKTNLALAIAAILDPRFKMKLVEYYYPQIYGENATECIDIVSNCMKELYNGHDIYSPLAAAGGGSHCQASNNNNDRLTGFDRFLHETSQSQNIKSDLDKYLEEPLFPRNADFSILNWWKVHTPRYPILSMMARNILGIPMSKVGFDNEGDRVVDQFRTSLNSDTLQALMCAHDWLSSSGLEDSKSSSSSSTLALCYDAN